MTNFRNRCARHWVRGCAVSSTKCSLYTLGHLRNRGPYHRERAPLLTMHEHYIFYLVALFGVIGIGWLVVVPMYKGWTPLNQRMSQRIRKSIRAMAEESRPGAC